MERDVQTDRRRKCSFGREVVRAILRGPVPFEWRAQAPTRISVGEIDEDSIRVFDTLQEAVSVQTAAGEDRRQEQERNSSVSFCS